MNPQKEISNIKGTNHALELATDTEDGERKAKAKWKDSLLVILARLAVPSRISLLIFLYFEGPEFPS